MSSRLEMIGQRGIGTGGAQCAVVLCIAAFLGALGAATLSAAAPQGIRVGPYQAEVRKSFAPSDDLALDTVTSIALDGDGAFFAATRLGLVLYEDGRWSPVVGFPNGPSRMAVRGDALIGMAQGTMYRVSDRSASAIADVRRLTVQGGAPRSLAAGATVWVGTDRGLFELSNDRWRPVDELNRQLGSDREVRAVAVARDGRVAVAADAGLFLVSAPHGWHPAYPRQEDRSWAPRDVRGVAFDRQDRLWFCCPQGVGVHDGQGWTLYTGHDGLPYNDFTTMAAGDDGTVWFGTTRGAIRFDGTRWQYRTAPRWLPGDHVRDIAVAADGTAWVATPQGIGVIQRKTMTLREKAEFFESEIDKYHRRTPYGFVRSVRLERVGDKGRWTQHDSDNDGLWTAMYGAGECFAYAATKDAKARKRATDAFEALRFLSQVTQGGSHPAPKGFPARTILPTTGPNPNSVHYTPQRDRQRQASDPMWKVIVPRWPTSEDGKWYWKCDTSSDELDGHYFLYALYYDLVAETEKEKQRVRDVVVAITDHLIQHDFQLIDHDGKPTRWGRFSPRELNGDVLQGARGLNSLSILSYLKVAEHLTGDIKYREAYERLVHDHSYATNTLDPKRRNGPGTGNQSDDEMAFMCYYNLLRYETDPRRRQQYLWSLRWYWLLEEPERNPLFNFIFAALDDGSRMPALRPPARGSHLADAVETLKQIPLDRILWSYENSHRLDVVTIPDTRYRLSKGGHLRGGKVVPVDERELEHWNQDPWRLDGHHDGRTLADGAAFLLPYYMGLHHGLVVE